MFPRNLADGLFSLHVGRPTAAMSVHVTIHPDGSLDECGLVASNIIPTRKLTYAEVDELLDATMPEQEPTLWALHKVRDPPPPRPPAAHTFCLPHFKVTKALILTPPHVSYAFLTASSPML